MQAGNKKVGKKATKLSLTKRAQQTGKKTYGIRNILEGNVDLNESSEFQQLMKLPSHGDKREKAGKERKIPAVTMAAKDNEVCTEGMGESTICQVCRKNMSHMTVQGREHHVNRCIDKIEVTEKQQKEEQLLLESARTAVLDCPMCGKHFKSENARLVHLKKCSVNVGVTTEKMLQLVKDQERERQEQLAAGIVPRELRCKFSKSVVSKKRKLKEPKSQFEEDVQVAMAVSSSLASEQIGGLSAGDHTRDGKRKKKKNTVLEDACLLTTLTDEDRQKRMEEKISSILQIASNVDCTKDTSLQDSCLKSGSQIEGHSLWKICSRDPVTCDNELFYVGALVPPLSVSHTETGKSLRRLSSIPGREKSFVKKKDNIKEKCPPGTPNMSADDIITASTQTAVVLAELAVDDSDIHDSIVSSQLTPDPVHEDHVVDLQASGFCVEKMVLNKNDQNALFSEMLADYKKMINSKDYSDVRVISCGQTFFAHKVILAVRCPKLLQMMTESAITLEVPPDIVLCFLNYIYTGDVTLTYSAQSELIKLAKQLDLPSFMDACNKAVLQTETSEKFAGDESIETSDTEFVESQLDMKEIWGESDSDLDLNKDDQNDDLEGQSDNGINDDEYREIICTQKMKLKGRHAQAIDSNVESNEKAVISENVSETLDGPFNEMYDVLINDYTDETGSDTGSSVISFSKGKEKDVISRAHLNTSGYYEVVDIDAKEEPQPKRIRIDIEKDCAKAEMHLDSYQLKQTDKVMCKVINEENADYSGFKCSNEHETSISDEEDIVDTTNSGINSSTADLFGSPTPKKSVVMLTDVGKIIDEIICHSSSLQSNSKFSTPLEQKADSKRTLNSGPLPLTPVINIELDSDSFLEDITDLNEKAAKNNRQDSSQIGGETAHAYENASMEIEHAMGNCQENKKWDGMDLETAENNITSEEAKTSLDFENSDDDLEITGDNFDDLTQQSPTFNHSRSSGAIKKLHVLSQEVSATKYLGLKSITEGLADKSQFKNSDNDCMGKNSRHLKSVASKHKHLKESISYKEEIDEMPTDVFDSCDVNNAKPFKTKHFKDLGSRSGEIITILTADSVADNDQSADIEMDRASTEHDDVPSHVKLSDRDEPCLKVGPVRDIQKSTSYGKHEMSVYSEGRDGTIVCSPNVSFDGNSTDVWDNFDDCGVAYESPCRSPAESSRLVAYKSLTESPRKTSPVIGYQEIEEGETSPIIPEQSEIIDLSRNEDDNNRSDDHVGSELDGNLLEDGDDSFVFKVDDQEGISDKPSIKTSVVKGTDFKTPTTNENCRKKKGPWMPPSPFTPMPHFDEMPTPALKKEVKRYGMKPVGKKRMVKVLEDIYHQTHQYETDSEVEGEGETVGPAEQGEVAGTLADNVPSSQDDAYSQDSDMSDLLEESCLHMSSDSDTSASPQKSIDLTRKLFDFVKSRQEIHTKILLYKPLELDVLKKDVKDAGIRCSMDKLMDFLDERCIAFTSKNTRKRQAGKRGHQKVTKSKQTAS